MHCSLSQHARALLRECELPVSSRLIHALTRGETRPKHWVLPATENRISRLVSASFEISDGLRVRCGNYAAETSCGNYAVAALSERTPFLGPRCIGAGTLRMDEGIRLVSCREVLCFATLALK